MKCKECGNEVEEKILEDKFQEADLLNAVIFGKEQVIHAKIKRLAQIAKEHYEKKFDEAEKKAGYLDNSDSYAVRFVSVNDLRKAMFEGGNE